MIRTSAALFGVGLLTITTACGTSLPSASSDMDVATGPSSLATKVGHRVGDRAPAFHLSLTDGDTVASASLAEEGKPVFLFFLATW